MKLVLATHNKGKIREFQKVFSEIGWEAVPVADVSDAPDAEETGKTFKENALQKAHYYAKVTNLPVLSDDSGIIADVLGDRPGVYSARYAGGEGHNAEANMQKLLQNMQGVQNRKAQFRTAICLILDGKKHLFEGIVKGEIIKEKRGSSGFGYDPIFVPEGYTKTFAELGNETKNKISHRALAVEKLCRFLKA